MRTQVPPWPSIAFVIVATLIGVYAIVGYRNLRALAGDYGRVTRSQGVLDEVDALLVSVLSADALTRGFVITADERVVPEFEAAERQSRLHLLRLAEWTRANPPQRQLVGRLADLVAEKHKVMWQIIRIRREEGFNAAQVNLMGSRGPQLMEEIGKQIGELRAGEQRLLQMRAEFARSTYTTALRAGIVMAVVALLLLTASYLLFWQAYANRARMAEALIARKDELEEAVRERTAELLATAQDLERSNRELEQFAFVASHDLQEPLRKIQTFSDRLELKQGAVLGDVGRDHLQRIRSAAERMQRLMDGLLAYSRVHSRGRPFGRVDLTQVVRDVLGDLEDLVTRTRGSVDVGPLPAIDADALQMHQLFLNLIGNALKFHRPGVPPAVRIEGEILGPDGPIHGEQGPLCRVAVRDNGIGFDAQYTDKLFEMFQRLHGSAEYEGSGIGLAISRRIVERHGGWIDAASRPGDGALFTVIIPVTQPDKKGSA